MVEVPNETKRAPLEPSESDGSRHGHNLSNRHIGNGICKLLDRSGHVGFIPELASIQRQATEHAFQAAVSAMQTAMENGDPSSGTQAMRMICAYLFAKSVESVMLWADSPDGRIQIDYDLGDLERRRYSTSLDEERSQAAIETMQHGAVLFDAHYAALTDRLMQADTPDEGYVRMEMREALEWTQRIAVAYALRKGYQAGGCAL